MFFAFILMVDSNWYYILVTILIVLWSWLNTCGEDYVKVGMRSENYQSSDFAALQTISSFRHGTIVLLNYSLKKRTIVL